MWIDVTRLVGRRLKTRLPTGVDRVALAYVERFGLGPAGGDPQRPAARALLRIGRLHLTLPPRASQAVFRWLIGAVDSPPSAPWAAMAFGLLAAVPAALVDTWRWPVPQRHAQAGPWLINAGHSGLEHAHWASGLRARGARSLLVIHDLIPITHPQFCRAGESRRHAQRMRHALTWASAVVTNSQATLDALAAWARAEHLPMPAATVARLGQGGGATPLGAARRVGERPLQQAYFVALGTLEPRKNHALLLKVWDRLVQRLGTSAAPRLVLIGQRGWEIESLLRELQRSPFLQGVVIERQHCCDAELAGWLAHAQALLMPSFVEGFGMPLVEGLAAGVPVLASDLPVFREIAGAVPEYLDPLDGPAWLAAVESYTRHDGQARQAQIARLQDFRVPTWAGHFDAVEALMASGSVPQGTAARSALAFSPPVAARMTR